jgi:hypothetical protein
MRIPSHLPVTLSELLRYLAVELAKLAAGLRGKQMTWADTLEQMRRPQ